MSIPASLIGRDEEFRHLTELLDSSRVVSLVGPGGVGKTTLVEAVLDGRAGILFGRLAPLAVADLDDSLAGSLGFASFAALSAALESRDAILVLDNCEHVLDAAAEIAEALVDTHPGLRVVATSREPLGIHSERVLKVEPLKTDGHPSPAAQMFVARMQARGLPVPDDLTDIESLCRSLDGLPLALELASSRAASMTPADIADNLQTRLDLLSRSRSRGPQRHQSITAAVGWSFNLLADDLKELFLTVSVFAGAFTVRMATRMSEGADEATIAEQLGALVDRSLIVYEPVEGRSWYRMLSTIRVYGVERLRELRRFDVLNERLADQAAEASSRIKRESLTQNVPAAGIDEGQLFRVMRSAIDWCVANDADPDRAIAIATAFSALEDSGFQAEAADAVELVINTWGVEDAEVYGVLAIMSRASGQVERARSAATRCIDLGGTGTYFGHRVLGLIARAEGDFDLAVEEFHRGAGAAREEGHEGYGLELETHAALAVARSGRIDEAVAMFDRLIIESTGHCMVTTMALLMAGLMLVGSDIDRSIDYSTRSLEQAEEVNYPWAVNHARQQLALARYLRGDTRHGIEEMAESISYAAVRGSRSETWLGLRFAARMFAAHGETDAAAAALAAARRVFGDPVIGPSEQWALDSIHPEEIDRRPAEALRIPQIVDALEALASSSGPSSDGEATDGGNRFIRKGDVWEIGYGNRSTMMTASKGIADLVELIGRPNTDVAAVDLVGALLVDGDAGPVSDAAARRSYEQRIRELQQTVTDAEAASDIAAAEKATAELDALVGHLAAAYGLAGSERTVGSVAEKARSAVTWRIRAAIDKITDALPELGSHLDRTIRTGRFCRYDVDEPPDWIVRT